MTTLSSEAERLASRLLVNGLTADEEEQVAALLRRIPELEAERDRIAAIADELQDQLDRQATRFAQVEAQRDQLQAELEKVRWQPIEAAPTGEQVLLFGSRGLEWFVDDWGRYAKYNNPRITHWMPLPAAPTSPNADQKGEA